jgi:hypothetical protein
VSANVSIPAAPGTGVLGSPRSVGLSILWTILTIGIYSFFWTYWTFDEMRRYSGQGVGGPIGLVIYLCTFFVTVVATVITCILISSELAQLYEREGRQAEHSALWGLWLLLPIVGPFIWFIPTQQALNAFWESKGAQPA